MITFYRTLLNTIPRFNIVYGYIPKRSPFDKTHYIENFIPRQIPFPKTRRPRLNEWEDESQVWPIIPPSPIQNRKQLLKDIANEELQRLQLIKPMTFPDFRVGDVIQVKWIHNMSEPNVNIYQGLCVGRRNQNSLDASFKFIFRYCGVDVFMNIKQNSPYLKEVLILKKGSGNIRNKTAMWRKRLAKQQFITPLVRAKSVRRRDDPPVQKHSTTKKIVQMQESVIDPLLVEKPVEKKKSRRTLKREQNEQQKVTVEDGNQETK